MPDATEPLRLVLKYKWVAGGAVTVMLLVVCALRKISGLVLKLYTFNTALVSDTSSYRTLVSVPRFVSNKKY